MTAGATAAGTRAYIAQKHFSWVTPKRLHWLTVGLLAAAVLASGLFVSGSTAPTHHTASSPSSSAHVR